MKLVTFMRRPIGAEEIGVLRGEIVVPVRELGFSFADMNDLILRAEKADLDAMAAVEGPGLTMSEITLLSPIPRPLQDVLCLGLNYAEHAREASGYSQDAFGLELDAPIFFSKRVGLSQGDGAPIPAHTEITQKVDYENELAVILGKDALNVVPEDVENYIFGYTVLNDLTARDLQTKHKQWYFGKSLDGFCPMGPCIVTADEIPYPPAQRIFTTLNGRITQDSNTNCLIHSISEIVSTLSRGMVLKAGTIIATGTPKGVLMGEGAPRFLQKGDVICCTIEGIGSLTNTVE